MDFYKGCKTRKQFMNDMTKWFIRENKLGKVKVICEYDSRMDCWGDCTNLGKNRFHIRVHPEQSLQSYMFVSGCETNGVGMGSKKQKAHKTPSQLITSDGNNVKG